MNRALIPVFAVLSFLCPELAESADPNKRLRDLSADRPDLTESPYTVDAGHVQIEMDLLRYGRDEAEGSRAESWSPLTLNLKAGLDPSTDVQVVSEWRRFERVTDLATGAHVSGNGFGDLTVRLKRNLCGNDAGRVAVAALPYVSFPTASEGFGAESVTYGIAIPVGVELDSRTGLGLMGQVDLAEDSDTGHHAEWTATATLGRSIAGPFGGFVEFAATFVPSSEGTWIGTANAGITCSLSPNLQLDAGTYLGISDAADDRTFFLGLTARR